MEHDIFITPKTSQHLDNFDNVCELLCQGGPTLHSELNRGGREIIVYIILVILEEEK